EFFLGHAFWFPVAARLASRARVPLRRLPLFFKSVRDSAGPPKQDRGGAADRRLPSQYLLDQRLELRT
ncbi:hypothetical protein, partial [Methylosinus sp. R-45379]|uniref:hypothetical protein n=1 Tax=Methylosinus sp. R-45379 TaxID=980563 RepID=UPI001AEC751E